MKITDTWLREAIAKNRDKPKYRKTVDRGPGANGLMVTVYSDGTAAFVMRYTRPSGKRVFMPLGSYGRDGRAGLSLKDACDLHDEKRKLLGRGIDPIDEALRHDQAEERARHEREGADTLADLVSRFVRLELKGRKRPGEAAALLGYVDPDKPIRQRKGKRRETESLISRLGNRKAREIRKKDLVALLDAIVERGAPITANRIHALLVQLFRWAEARGELGEDQQNPMYGVRRPTRREPSRNRVLSEAELKKFWKALPDVEMAEPTRLALKLLLATAQRRGEITQAKWSHFDFEKKHWTIPVELLKSSHSRRSDPEPHIVPLSPLALEILGELKAVSGAGIYVLPARGDVTKHGSYSERVLSRAVRENEADFGIPHFTPHDLRRTAASLMTKIGVPRLHVEKVLNHSTGDIAEVYDRHDYLPEKKAALEKWSEHLQQIISGRSDAAAHDSKRAA